MRSLSISSSLRLYLRYVGISLRGQMQYRMSFIFLLLGHLLISVLEFVAMWALFDRFGHLKGWTLPEAALFYGIVNIAWALADATARGFDLFGDMVKSGDFDRLLLRPRSTAFQLAARELTLKRAGRLLQGLVILLYATSALQVEWTMLKMVVLIGAILGGACLFYGIVILQATLAFWTTEGLEIMNALTYGGVEAGQYPMAIYHPAFQRFFTLVVPLATVTYFPALLLLDRAEGLLLYLAPLAGPLFLAVALKVWEIGVRHYRSTGS